MRPPDQEPPPTRGSEEPLPGRCGARVRGGDGAVRYCRSRPVRGRNRCRMHGGTTPSGPAHHAWKHGRYSAFLPPELLSRTRALLDDPNVLSLVPNLQLIDAHLLETYQAMHTPERAAAWDRVRSVADRMEQAIRDNRADLIVQLYVELRQAVKDGRSLLDLAREARELHEQRRRLVRTEAARQQGEHSSMSYDKVVGLLALLLDIMFRHISDAKIRRRIIDDVRALELKPGVAVESVAPTDGSGSDHGLRLVRPAADLDD